MRVRRSCLLPCTVERLVSELTRPALLDYLSWPMLVFDPVEPSEALERWSLEKYRFRLLIAGRIFIGEHVINVQRTVQHLEDVSTDPVVWHDAGYSDLIRVWDHKIVLEDFLGMTRYTDDVGIYAGPLTVPAWLFAMVLYLHRQRRLNRLVAAGFGY
jgi:hypothetical protein